MAGNKPTIVVELTSEEERLLNGFRKAQAADEELRAGLKKTGEEVDETGKSMVDAMVGAAKATTINTDKIMRQLKSTGEGGRKLFKGLEQHMSEFSLNGRQSVDQVLGKLEKVDATLAGQARRMLAEWEKTDNAAKFEKTRAQLEALGGDFGLLGAEIKKATKIPEDRIAAAKELVNELNRIDPGKAQVIARAMEQSKKAIEKSRLDQFVQQLAGGSKEAKELANALGIDMKEAALEAEGGIEGISWKILSLRPDLKKTVDKWKSDMAEAARFGEGKYKKALDALRAGGTVSKQVAEKIKANLVAAGHVVERTFEDMVKPLEQIDPKLAKEAKMWQKHLSDNEKRSKGTFSRISQHAITQIGTIAGAYFGIQEAVQFVSESIREQQEILKGFAEKQGTLAGAQQEAGKNLAAFDRGTQQDLLLKLVPQTMKGATFSDAGALTKAIGDMASAGATPKMIKDFLPVAASLTRFTPDFIDKTGTAMVDSAAATGTMDPRVLISDLMLTGSQSRVVDPAKLLRNVSPVQVSAANSVPKHLRAEAARQGSAMFAAFTKAGADATGDASQTASIQYMARIRSFFQGLGKDASEAETELKELRKSDPVSASMRQRMKMLGENEASKNRVDFQISDNETRQGEIQGLLDGTSIGKDTRRNLVIEKRKLKAARSKLSPLEFSDRDAASLADMRSQYGEKDRAYQKRVAELEGTIAAADIKGFRGKAPVLPFDQIRAIQQNAQLGAAFGSITFGEQRFRSAGEQMASGGDAFQNMMSAYQLNRTKGGRPDLANAFMRTDDFLTPQMEQRFLNEKTKAANARREYFDIGGAEQGSVRAETAEILKKTRSQGVLANVSQRFGEVGVSTGLTLGGSSTAEEIVSSITRFVQRRHEMAFDGVSNDEEKTVQQLDDAIEAYLARLSSTEIRKSHPVVLGNLAARTAITAKIASGTSVHGTDVGEYTANSDTFQQIALVLAEQVQIQRQMLAEARKTSGNTKQNGRTPTDAMRGAAGNADRRRGQ